VHHRRVECPTQAYTRSLPPAVLLLAHDVAVHRTPQSGAEQGTAGAASDVCAAAVIASLKHRHGLLSVWCWHALLGYWSGAGANVMDSCALASVAAAPPVAAAAAAAALQDRASGAGPLEVAVAAVNAAEAAVTEADLAASPTAVPVSLPSAAMAASDSEGLQPQQNSSSPNTLGGSGGCIVAPRVTEGMSDLEPPCNWSQLVCAVVCVH
jgi:Raffinose synthase or seed imbibition protein Sip1